VSKTERIYALLVEANPVPDPDALPERLADAVPHLHVIDPRREPMDTETTQPQTPPQTGRNWLPALGAAALIIAVVAGGALLLSDPGVDTAADREAAAIAKARAYFTAINSGGIDEAVALASLDGSSDEATRGLIEFGAVATASYPWQLQGCEVVGADDEAVLVDCAFVNTDPVFVATGVSELVAPFTVFDDGTMVGRNWQGANFALANRAYADYLRTRHEADYNRVCHRSAYPTGSVNSNGGMVFTRECAELAIPLAPTIADWVDAGKPGA